MRFSKIVFAMLDCSLHFLAVMLIAILAASADAAQAAEETVPGMLAAQIRSQGYSCDKAIDAVRDATRSGPDHAVWVLKCGNASYRVSRAPDMAAKIEPLQ